MAIITKTARPIIDVDYFVAVLLFFIPYRIVRVIAFLAFALAVFFDVIMFTMQMFPFMDLSGFLYFLPFIKIAPFIYQFLVLLVILLVLLLPYTLIKLSTKTTFCHLLLVLVPIGLFGYFTQHL